MRVRVLLLAVLLTALAAACGSDELSGPPASSPSTTPTSAPNGLFGRGTVTIDTGEDTLALEVEVARSEAARQRGLMERTELAPEAGMIFVFEDEAIRGFWMKNTLIPLSIAFFGADARIHTLTDMAPCDADPCTLYYSNAPSQGALEVNAGYFAEHGVEIGDTVTLVEE